MTSHDNTQEQDQTEVTEEMSLMRLALFLRRRRSAY
jgi:hypothetical protein